MHKLLARQLRKYLSDEKMQTRISDFLAAVESAYQQADNERTLLERSLELSSRELTEQFHELQSRLEEITQTKAELEHSLSLLNTTLDATADGVFVVDLDQKPLIRNPVFNDLFRIDPTKEKALDIEHIKEHVWRNTVNKDELEALWREAVTNPGFTGQCQLQLKDGRFIDCRCNPRRVNGEVSGTVWSLSDISNLKRQEQQALFHTYYDALTGLPNRTLFQERLSHALELMNKEQAELAVVFIDLDAFKEINDSRGLEWGDEVLKGVADRLREVVPRDATIARQSSDEFLILYPNLKGSFSATLFAEAVRAALLEPFVIEGDAIRVTCSLGLALAPADGKNPESLIRKADMAMHQAKAEGRNNFQFFAQEFEVLAKRRLTIRNQLREAISRKEFHLLYQPKVSLSGPLTMTGCEALIRWQKSDGTIVSPVEFIPAAEEFGFIVEIGEWVIEEACRQLAAWRAEGLPLIPVAINISAHQLQQSDLTQKLASALNRHKLPVSLLEIELTESALMEPLERNQNTLREVQDLGVKIAIDDFGTGYSSFGYLKTLPVDIIKIDKSFIDGMAKSHKDTALVKTLVQLAHTLELQVVAEGIETVQSAELLSLMGCDYAQGYHFSRPVPANKLYHLGLPARSSTELLRSRR